MRDIGHKISTHGISLFQLSDIAAQQQPAPIASREPMQRQALWCIGPAHSSFHHDPLITTGLMHERIESGISNQMGDQLEAISLRIQSQVLRHGLVAGETARRRLEMTPLPPERLSLCVVRWDRLVREV